MGYRFRSLASVEHVCDTTQGQFLLIVRTLLLSVPYRDNTRSTTRTDQDSLRLRQNSFGSIKKAFALASTNTQTGLLVVHQASVNHQSADALPKLRKGVKKTSYQAVDVPVRNVENRQMTNDGRPYAQECMECDVEKDVLTKKHEGGVSKKKNTRVSTIKRTEQNTGIVEVPTIKDFTEEQTKEVYCRKTPTQARMKGS